MRTDKQGAIRLRKLGKSYSEINRLLRIPKSTLSLWLKELSVSKKIKNQNVSRAKLIWAKNIVQYNVERARQARLRASQIQAGAKQEITNLSQIELKMIGAALYWAEGHNRAKWNAVFCNSNPHMVKLMMRFFREICEVPENRFRPQVQIHPNVSVEDAELYWSDITNLNIENFAKPLTQISSNSKKKRPPRRLPYGTFRIRIADAKCLYKIKGWIEGLVQQS